LLLPARSSSGLPSRDQTPFQNPRSPSYPTTLPTSSTPTSLYTGVAVSLDSPLISRTITSSPSPTLLPLSIALTAAFKVAVVFVAYQLARGVIGNNVEVRKGGDEGGYQEGDR